MTASRNLIPTETHPSNRDKTARIVRERRGEWTVYAVRCGHVVTFHAFQLMALDGLFETEAEAVEAAEASARAKIATA